MTSPLEDEEDEDDLHSLLARGGLSGAQRDRIFDNVAAAQAPARRSRRWVGVVAGALVPLAALVAFGISRRDPNSGGEWLVAKGSGKGATIEARCPGRKRGECRAGDRLIFELDGAKEGGFFAGYADCEGKERIWYAPSFEGKLPQVPPAQGHTVVSQAARIGAEHGATACSLHLFLLAEPADRARVASGAAALRSRAVVRLKMIP